MNLLRQIDDKFEEYLAATLLTVMTLLIFFQVLSRFIFNAPLAWSEESARYIFVWSIYISAALAVKRREHIRVEVGIMIFKGKARKVANLVGDLIFMLFSFVLLKDGLFLVQKLGQHVQYSPALGVPMDFVYIIIPLGYGLMLLRLIQKVIIDIKNFNNPDDLEKTM